MSNLTMVDHILAMTDTERSDALCFISGYAPEAVEAALKGRERQHAYHMMHENDVQSAWLQAYEDVLS
jgi:hypothetical protein